MAIRGRRFHFFNSKFKIQTIQVFLHYCDVFFSLHGRYWRFFHESPSQFCQVQRLVGAYENRPCKGTGRLVLITTLITTTAKDKRRWLPCHAQTPRPPCECSPDVRSGKWPLLSTASTYGRHTGRLPSPPGAKSGPGRSNAVPAVRNATVR